MLATRLGEDLCVTADGPPMSGQKSSSAPERPPPAMPLDSIEAVQRALASQQYIADRGLATAVFLALRRNKPLLLEGEPGVGKTEVARVLADVLRTRLIRVQCYEGIYQSTAVYEWNYARQLLAIRL